MADEEVRDADRAGETFGVELLEHAPALEPALVRPVQEVEVDTVQSEPLEQDSNLRPADQKLRRSICESPIEPYARADSRWPTLGPRARGGRCRRSNKERQGGGVVR